MKKFKNNNGQQGYHRGKEPENIGLPSPKYLQNRSQYFRSVLLS